MEKVILDIDELQTLASEQAQTLRGAEVIALIGNLGAGKTTFTKALLKASGVKTNITSPTFGIIAEHHGKNKNITFHHVDLYRINNIIEFKALGIEQAWQQPETIYIIEWADKISDLLPKGTIIINFEHINSTKRAITVHKK